MSDDVFALYVIPQADEIARNGRYPFNWQQSPFTSYIGADLFAFITDDDDDEFNETATAIVGAIGEHGRDIYGTLGIVRLDGEALDEVDIAFAEALAADPETVGDLQPPAGDIDLIATTLDWRTLAVASIPEDNPSDRDGVRYTAGDHVTLDTVHQRRSVTLVDRGYIEPRHLNDFLDDRFGHTGGRRRGIEEAANAYRESAHWRLSTWRRILTTTRNEEDLTALLAAAASGTPDEYLFAIMD